MAGEPLDLKKIRRNWDLAGSLEPDRPGGRLGAVPAPLDPFAAARADVGRLRALLASEFAPHLETLAPFLRRLDDALARLEALTTAPDPPAERDADALRDELHDALHDLEDLLEVFSLPSR